MKPEDFPDDETGDVLRTMLLHGDDLSLPRTIDFSVVFPSKISATQAMTTLLKKGLNAKLEKSDLVERHPWELTVRVLMVPSHKGIAEVEFELQEVAKPLNGRNDGWGCFQQIDSLKVQ